MALSGFTSALGAGSALWYLVTALVVYYVVSSAIAWNRLRGFPGPLVGKFSYLWLMSNARSGKPGEHFTKLNREHGPLVRIGPNDLVTDDPDILRRMNAVRSTYGRSSWYDSTKLNPHEDSMFSLRDVGAHDRLKAKCAGGYAGKENPTLEDGIDAQIANFVDLVRRKYITAGDDVKPMDMGKVAQYFTLDTITKLAYGKEFGYLATDSDVHDYISTTEATIPYLQLCSEVPFIQDIVFSKAVLGTVGPKHTDKSGLGKLMGVAKEVVAKRFGPDAKEERDMLGAFVRHGLTQTECETEVLFQIIAGSDTTATAIRTTFLYTMTSPRTYNTLKQEIATAIAEGRISSPITYEEGKKLPYLQAVIYEGLRMNAPFTGLCAKEVPPEGDTIDGKFIPGGTRIAQNFWGTLRRFDVFGKDADLFRPERWIEADEAARDKMQKTTELAFGYGRWGCAGKSVAFMELNKIYVELLRNFDFQVMNPGNPWHSVNFNLHMQDNFWVKVTEAAASQN
ncbi:cytochrome P450 [Colletotrichum graminicola M1.001]|uniref:Cytochrome P450 monooxygenase ABA1 n=1 Tax=Colletotrichum graminicola (strain M1.001 / M2 / FGSC 10212) TaxID=645133 RepID=E3QPR0_COLGM|nr:cytochrome P450 [Colletotrichum graminicola M1.001]EFQ32837.1 cytochrome P450 [Colletotrichum graminicola M1.001]